MTKLTLTLVLSVLLVLVISGCLGEVDRCAEIEDKVLRDNCYYERALEEGDRTLCEKITYNLSRESCLSQLDLIAFNRISPDSKILVIGAIYEKQRTSSILKSMYFEDGSQHTGPVHVSYIVDYVREGSSNVSNVSKPYSSVSTSMNIDTLEGIEEYSIVIVYTPTLNDTWLESLKRYIEGGGKAIFLAGAASGDGGWEKLGDVIPVSCGHETYNVCYYEQYSNYNPNLPKDGIFLENVDDPSLPQELLVYENSEYGRFVDSSHNAVPVELRPGAKAIARYNTPNPTEIDGNVAIAIKGNVIYITFHPDLVLYSEYLLKIYTKYLIEK